MSANTSLLFPLVIFLPWIGALAVLVAGHRIRAVVAIAFAAADGLVSLALLPLAGSGIAFSLHMGGIFGDFSLVADGLGVFLAAVAAVIGCLAVVFSVDYMRGEEGLGRYYALVLFFIGSMIGLVLSSNLLMIVVFWEITAFCSYALISFHSDDPKAVAGGIKAMIVTGLGGVGLLAGAFLIYSQIGSFDLSTFLHRAPSIRPDLLAWISFAFLAAAAAKSAQFPFQTWLPDAMEAPTPISALIHAATMVNAGVYLLARVFPACSGVSGWSTTVVAIGAISALLAAVMAVASTDLKRVLAYSTVSQLGFMVFSIGVGGIFQSQFHLLSHSLFKALLFLGAGAVIHATGTRDMRAMGGLSRSMPVTCAVFLIGALALAGIPPANGFWSKELILEAGQLHATALAYFVMLATVGLTALYSARCVWMVFFARPVSQPHAHEAGPAMMAALFPLAAGTLASWLLAGPFHSLLARTLPLHFGSAPEIRKTWEIVQEVVVSRGALVALIVVAAGVLAWVLWNWLVPASGKDKPARALEQVRKAAEAGLGFESINRGVIRAVQWSGEKLRVTQSGILNWNVAAIVIAVVAVLAILAAGG